MRCQLHCSRLNNDTKKIDRVKTKRSCFRIIPTSPFSPKDAIFLCVTAFALVLVVLTKNGTRYNRFFPVVPLTERCLSIMLFFAASQTRSENKAVLNLLDAHQRLISPLSSFLFFPALSVFWSYYLNWLLVWLHPTWRLQRECLLSVQALERVRKRECMKNRDFSCFSYISVAVSC